MSLGRTVLVLFLTAWLAAAVRAGDPPEKLQLDFARGLYQREYYPMAVEEYRKLLRDFPDSAAADEAMYRIGDSLRLLRRQEEAVVEFGGLVERFPASPYWEKAKYRLGELNYLLGKLKEAAGHLRELAPRAVDAEIKSAALFLLGKIQYDQGDLEGATQALGALARSPQAGLYAAYAHFTLAQISLKKNEPQQALSHFRSVLASSPSATLLPETHYEIGRLEFGQGRFGEAAAAYRKVITDYPGSPFVAASVNGLVASLFENGQWDACVEAVRQHLGRAAPAAQPDLLYLAANAHRQRKQWSEAIATYDRLAREHGNWDRLDAALAEQVRCFYDLPDPGRVVAAADAFLKRFPKSALGVPVALLAGEVLFGQKQYAEAVRFYDAVLAADPKSAEAAEAAYRKGWSYFSLRQWQPASEAFRYFVARWPQDGRVAEALVCSAQAQQAAGNFAEAIRDYSAYNGRFPSDKHAETVLYQLGLCYGETKDYEAMAATLGAFVDKYPRSDWMPEARYWLGWNAFRQKHWEQAVEHFSQALPKARRAADARLKLALCYFSLEQPARAAPLVADLLKTDLASEIPLEFYHTLAQHHMNSGQHAEAAAVYGQMVKMVDEKAAPGWAVAAYLGHGQAALARQEYAPALASFQKVIALAPDSAQAVEALLGQARAHLAMRQFAEGEAAIDRVLTLQPEGRHNLTARFLRGELLMAEAKFEEAAKHFETVALLFADADLAPQALAQAAHCLESAGRADEAARLREDLKQKYPDFPLP